MASYSQLWMRNLQSYMTESFIMNAFKKMGESPTCVKIVKDKVTQEPNGNAFVHFTDDYEANIAFNNLNNRPIPGSYPLQRFRLKFASTSIKRQNASWQPEFSIKVENLSSDVTDFALFKCLSSRYKSVKVAKIKQDSSGQSKGYGFVRFTSEEEAKDCYKMMNNYTGLGSKPIKISLPQEDSQINHDNGSLQQSNYNSGSFYNQPSYQSTNSYWNQLSYNQNLANYNNYNQGSNLDKKSLLNKKEDEFELVDHSKPVDIEQMNRELIERDVDFWDGLENSKWVPHEIQIELS